ncbi:MAG: sel1 repeat family protein, partial [Deferribacteraceae bacterium]|nr:sel1 repeat family protein [Deferribacteraceae bacterium]
DAQYAFAVCLGVLDYDEAVYWYQKAAEQGHARAKYELARCYEAGIGIEQDAAEAVRLYHEAMQKSEHIHKMHKQEFDICFQKTVELDSIKYIINGVTKYLTYEEFKTLSIEQVKESWRMPLISSSSERLEQYIQARLEDVKRYDGDPFGSIREHHDFWQQHHEFLELVSRTGLDEAAKKARNAIQYISNDQVHYFILVDTGPDATLNRDFMDAVLLCNDIHPDFDALQRISRMSQEDIEELLTTVLEEEHSTEDMDRAMTRGMLSHEEINKLLQSPQSEDK